MDIKDKPKIFVIDDNKEVTESLRWLFESVNYEVETFNNANNFLAAYKSTQPGCLILDVRMPEITGLELQEILKERNISIPIIFMTAHADVPMAVRAMKLGAVDFLTKPVNNQTLLETINKAIKIDMKLKRNSTDTAKTAAKAKRLTSRENEVMMLILEGKLNKHIASHLGISQKTVELHRSNVMKKMGAKTAAELVRLALTSGVIPNKMYASE